MYVCLCRGLTEDDVRRAGRAGSTTAEALVRDLRLDDPCCCGRCARNVHKLVLLVQDEVAEPAR